MTQAIRQQINGTTPQDIRKINDNTESIWEKVHGDLNFEDSDNDVQVKIMTQYVPVQSEGNLDYNFPLDVRFYIPPNVKKIKSTSFNINVENYRMDSDIAMNNAETVPVSVTSSVSPMSISARVEDTSQTSLVTEWGNYDTSNISEVVTTSPPLNLAFHYLGMPQSDLPIEPNGGNAPYIFMTNLNLKFAPCYMLKDYWGGNIGWYVDLSSIQHKHDITHSHTFTQSPHKHDISASVTLPPHTHNLREGIKVSTTPPQGINVTLNGISIASMSYTNPSIVDLNVKDYVKIGQWNKITFTTSNLARIVFYGIIELELKNVKEVNR